MHDSAPVTTPLVPGATKNLTLPPSEDEKIADPNIPYREAIGCLMYLAVCTRPDLSFTVSLLSRYASNYTWKHWPAVLRVLRYIRGTSIYGLRIGGTQSEELRLIGYADADFANDESTRKSQTGYLYQLGGSTIS